MNFHSRKYFLISFSCFLYSLFGFLIFSFSFYFSLFYLFYFLFPIFLLNFLFVFFLISFLSFCINKRKLSLNITQSAVRGYWIIISQCVDVVFFKTMQKYILHVFGHIFSKNHIIRLYQLFYCRKGRGPRGVVVKAGLRNGYEFEIQSC